MFVNLRSQTKICQDMTLFLQLNLTSILSSILLGVKVNLNQFRSFLTSASLVPIVPEVLHSAKALGWSSFADIGHDCLLPADISHDCPLPATTGLWLSAPSRSLLHLPFTSAKLLQVW